MDSNVLELLGGKISYFPVEKDELDKRSQLIENLAAQQSVVGEKRKNEVSHTKSHPRKATCVRWIPPDDGDNESSFPPFRAVQS